MSTFADFHLLPSLQKTLKELKIKTPTEIQTRALPLLLEGKSVVGVSETGSGKTLAYVLPLLHQLKTLDETQPINEEGQPRAIVLVPTRELGEQVSKVFKSFTHTTRLRVRTVLGGTALEMSRRNIGGCFEILVATPGRLTEILTRDLIRTVDVRTIVFDEADQMLDAGFLPDANRVVKECGPGVQMALFSATVSTLVQDMMTNLFADAEVIRSKGASKVVSTLKTSNRKVVDGKRWPVLEKVLREPTSGGTLIFVNTRDQVDVLAKLLTDAGEKCLIYRGEMDKVERRSNLRAFRDGKVKLLISTDLGSRGLDVEHIDRVINYHLPKEMANYLHRVGRTARAGRKGLVVNLVTERDERLIERVKG